MIYCVEDDRSVRELIVYALKSGGYTTLGFSNSESFNKELDKALPTLIILDIMLPGEDGMEILKKLKGSVITRDIPVIMLTAKSTEYDKVLGLDSGADDYITKPFGIMELLARVRALLRRTNEKGSNKQELKAGNINMSIEKHKVVSGDQQVDLTYKEFELLRYLLENRGIVLTRDKLLKEVWGYDYEGETRTVDVHIRSLRHKLGSSGQIIETVRGVGYKVGGNI